MELVMIGLGRMGLNMAKRLMRAGHKVHGFDRSADNVAQAKSAGAAALGSMADIRKLGTPRTVWVMVPAGGPTQTVIDELAGVLEKGDTVIDGANSNFHDTVTRHAQLKSRGIHFLDSGTSGGIWGLENGYCLMIGGEPEAYRRAEPIFVALAPPDGFTHVGGPGAGHFVKMVHNGIEYALMQSYAEGFEIMRASDYGIDLHKVCHLWNQGGVVRSWLLELAERAFQKDPDLAALAGYVEDSGMGRWTIQEAMARDVPAPVITLSLLARFRSRQPESFQAKVLAALRNEFGGHAVRPAGQGKS
ncbi:MAG TPA: decarboxylating 6-phosphogluconate dehydrogenase [Candidatus Acidoferrales bacterium]